MGQNAMLCAEERQFVNRDGRECVRRIERGHRMLRGCCVEGIWSNGQTSDLRPVEYVRHCVHGFAEGVVESAGKIVPTAQIEPCLQAVVVRTSSVISQEHIATETVHIT